MQTGNQSSSDFLDAVVAAMREGRWRAAGIAEGPESPGGAVETAAIEKATELLHRVQGGDLDVGLMPPKPPTLRASAGAAIVRLVRRAMFWMIQPVRQFQVQSAEATKATAEWLQLNLRRTVELQAALQMANERTGRLEERLDRLSDVASALDSGVEGAREALSAVRGRIDEHKDVLADVRREIASMRQGETEARILSKELAEVRTRTQALEEGLKSLAEVDRHAREMRRDLTAQERRLSMALEEFRRSAASNTQGPARAEVDDDIATAWYTNFEDAFRGSRAEIKERLRVYLPALKEAGSISAETPALDLGCGRGEWLELLNEEGLAVRGIDLNEDMVARCRNLGLPAEHHDALAYLRSLGAESLGAVTGFHIVEHLSLPVLLALVDEAVRVLRPGGVCIFETPNPSNLRVSTYTFYLDPSHRNPIPKELLAFLVEARGLCRAKTIELHPYPDSFRLPDDGRPATRVLNELLWSSQDYAVIARKV